ncbi:MAG: DUF4340 domain-containing protein [Lachnospiraceae bacterium]|nr:DUF4340 domain-containing protein [Lachnospiraceae bacterium]
MNSKRRNRLLILCLCLVVMVGCLLAAEMLEAQREAEDTAETPTYTITNITPDEIVEIGIIRKEGESLNLKKEVEAWRCLEDSLIKLDTDTINSFLEDASSLISDTKIEDVNDLEQYGLEEPYLNVTLQLENNMYVIKVGNYNSVISAYYVQIGDEPVVYTITSTQYYQLNKALEDFELIEETDSEVTVTE